MRKRDFIARQDRDETSLFSAEATRGIELRAIHLPAARLIDRPVERRSFPKEIRYTLNVWELYVCITPLITMNVREKQLRNTSLGAENAQRKRR